MVKYSGISTYDIGGDITGDPDFDIGYDGSGEGGDFIPFSVGELDINLLPNGSLVDKKGNKLV